MGRLSKDKRDVYYREAKRAGWRARSAFKLLQIDATTDLLSGVRNVADLCAAPGGWSQVLAWRLLGVPVAPTVEEAENETAEQQASCEGCADDVREAIGGSSSSQPARPIRHLGEQPHARIVAVDMYEMQPIEGVVQVRGDITQESAAQAVLRHFEGERADLVVCDGAPDVSGVADFDEYVQHQLVLSELHLACSLLRPGGSFLAKVFRGEHVGQLYGKLRQLFRDDVVCCKPRASRNSSLEAFVLGRGFTPLASLLRNPSCSDENGDTAYANCSSSDPNGCPFYQPCRHEELADLAGYAPVAARFVACGGSDALDADKSYPVDTRSHRVLTPAALPICPPYRQAIEERRGQKRIALTSDSASIEDATPSATG